MTLPEKLLEIICCPKTHQPLTPINDEQLTAVNALIAEKGMVQVNEESLTDSIDGGLLREDGAVLYPVKEGIPILLIEEGLRVPEGFFS